MRVLIPNRRLSREILTLAGPAIAGLSSQVIVSILTTAMVGRLEQAHINLAALGLGFLGSWAITSLFSSISTGTHVLVARRQGEGNPQGVGEVLNNSLALGFALGVFFGAIGYTFAYEIIDFFSKDVAVSSAGGKYMKYQFLGLPFFLLIVSYRGFFYGIGHTKIFMFSAIIINICNVVFNYIFIFGGFGIPAMELAGAGLGSALSMFVGWLFFLSVTFIGDYRKQFGYYSHIHFSKDIIKQIIKISLPVSTQNILILFGFLAFVAITGIIGITEQAASQVVISALFVTILPCFGFGIAAQTLVGQALGRREIRLANIYGYETAKLGTIFTLFIGVLFVSIPDAILLIMTTNKAVIETARPILQIAGVAQIFYASGIIIASALQAGGSTVYVMFIEIITHWVIFLPITYIFGIILGWGLLGAWMALPIYIFSYTILNLLKFRSSSWVKLHL